MRRNILFVFFILIVSACTYNGVYINSPEDSIIGRKYLDTFYKNIFLRQFQKNDSLMSDTLKSIGQEGGVSAINKMIDKKLGEYQSYLVSEFKSKRNVGSVNKCFFEYKLKVTYKKGVVDETLSFLEIDDQAPKILSYNVFSDLLVDKKNTEQTEEGKRFLNQFYDKIAKQDGAGADHVITEELKQKAGLNGISKIMRHINNKVGQYITYTVDDYYEAPLKGKGNVTSYFFKLKVTYEKGMIDEVIGLQKSGTSQILLNSYHANSDLLMK